MVKKEYYYVMYLEQKSAADAKNADAAEKVEEKAASVDIGDSSIYPLWISMQEKDKKWLRLFCTEDKREGQLLFRMAAAFGLRYLRRKYIKPLYATATNDENRANALILADKTRKELPRLLWESEGRDAFPPKVYRRFAERRLAQWLGGQKSVFLYIVIGRETEGEALEEIILKASDVASGLEIFVADFEAWQGEQELAVTKTEELLDIVFEETGLAGSQYTLRTAAELLPHLPQKKRGEQTQKSCLLDYANLPVAVIKNIDFYLDGTGKRTHRELRKLENDRIHCETLHNYLDRAFLGTL